MSSKIQSLAFPCCVMETYSATSTDAKAQTHLAIVHSINECFHESSSPHTAHLSSTAIFLCLRTSLVGRECFASLHRKTFILDGTWIRQREVHCFSTFFVSDEAADPSSQASLVVLVCTSILYADRTVKTPLRS